MSDFNLNEAMAALKASVKTRTEEDLEKALAKVQIVGPRGDKGDPGVCICREPKDGRDGRPGTPGASGRDGISPILEIGEVTVSDKASASFHRDGNKYILNLALPKAERGSQGLRGESVVGPRGEPGVGERGAPGPQGIQGDSIVGPKGEPGISVNEEMLQGVVMKILGDIIGKDLVLQKMVQVRAELKRCIHEADARHISHFQTTYRKLDNIIG